MLAFAVTIEWIHVWIVSKILAGVFFPFLEKSYGGSKGGLKRSLFHGLIGLELGIIKLSILAPLWVFFRKRISRVFFAKLLPFKVKVNENCPVCKGTGIVRRRFFDKGRGCSCKISKAWIVEHNESCRRLKGLV